MSKEDYRLIEEFLRASFEDMRLSAHEKSSLAVLLKRWQHSDEMLAYARNAAFSVLRDHAANADQNAYIHSLRWLERVIKTIDNLRAQRKIFRASAHFSPGLHCVEQIIAHLQAAKEKICICVFTVSDDRIAESILQAHQRGVWVRLISDNDKAMDDGSDVLYLARQGVPVRLDRHANHMHHKFAIFDDSTLVNGSFNWTRSASAKNEENITVLYEPELLVRFSERFEQLWEKFEPF